MIVFVVERWNCLSVDSVKQIVKAGIEVKKFRFTNDLQPFDVVIFSEEDKRAKAENYYPARKISYEKVFERMCMAVMEEWEYRYGYYVLKNHLKKARFDENIDTIVTGSSYGLYGIDDENIFNMINLSLPSQDLYYSLEGVYDVCEYNNKIKNVVICCNYYYFYTDLSQVSDYAEAERLSKIYYPLFHDIHNCLLLPPKKEHLYKSDIFDCDKLLDIYQQSKKELPYFNSDVKRVGLKLLDNNIKEWQLLTEEEKKEAAIIRTNLHNKCIKYDSSFIENVAIFSNFVDFCNETGIRVFVVVTPVSSVYLELLDPRFKGAFYKAMDSIDGTVHLIDVCESGLFTDDDFVDTDHLNDQGAKKMTEIIMNELGKVE